MSTAVRVRTAVATAAASTLVAFGAYSALATAAPVTPDDPYYWAVTAGSRTVTLDELTKRGFDVANESPDAQGRWHVVGTTAVAEELRSKGYHTARLQPVYSPVDHTRSYANDTYYGGYHTPAAHWQHLRDVNAKYPQLTKLHNLGPSYLKSIGQGGHDIQGICITKMGNGDCELTTNSPKPKFVMMSQTHAREIATGELSWRWIDELTHKYGSDQEITTLLDTRELWVLPILNPDGVDRVASGGDRPILHRKNMNQKASGPCQGGYSSIGVDLNRNMDFNFQTSDDRCNETWNGPKGNSEVESQALDTFFKQIFPDFRDDDLTSTARPGAKQVALSLHSSGDMILHAWGYTKTPAPDGPKLTAIGKKLATWNRFRVGTPGTVLGYTGYGSHDDYIYGKFGVPFLTFEIGNNESQCGGFTPKYSCVDKFFATNRPAFIHLAKTADDPWNKGPR